MKYFIFFTFLLSSLLFASGGGPIGSGGGGVTTVGAFSASSQANGASISSDTITFGPADATNPGMVSTGTQTFAGAKTFTGVVSFADGAIGDPSITNTGDTNTGIYFPASDQVGISVGGVAFKVSIDSSIQNDSPSLSNAAGTYPSMMFKNYSGTENQNSIVIYGNFSAYDSKTSETWLGGIYHNGVRRVSPWYGGAIDRLAMGYSLNETIPSLSAGEIKVKTGTNLTLSADQVRYGNYNMQPSENDEGTCATTKTVDWTEGSAQTVELLGNCTFTLSNP